MRYSVHTGQTSDNGEASRPRASHCHPSDAYSLTAEDRKRAEWASPTNNTNEGGMQVHLLVDPRYESRQREVCLRSTTRSVPGQKIVESDAGCELCNEHTCSPIGLD